MQLGFILLETGQVRKRNQMNIISKNFFDICVSTLAFYLCGYAFSTNADGGVIGTGKFLTLDFNNETFLDWFYKYSLCSASTTIVSGSLAERTFVDTYILYAVLMTTTIYPIASSWIIGEGWLAQLGFHDAAGAGYIHMLGGVCGLVGTSLLGPRSGIFDKTTVNKLVKQANQRKKILTKNMAPTRKKGENFNMYNSNPSHGNSTSNSSTMEAQVKNFNFENRGRENKDLKNFYNFDEETPMKFRIYLFRQQFKEFSTLKQDQCVKLIQLYDKNLNKSHELNSSQFAIIGSLFLYVGWLMLNASSVFQIKYK
jgi:ammonia channel protein AmtB